MPSRRFPFHRTIEATILVACCAFVLAVGLSQSPEAQYDDAFITYRYARNLIAGHGFVFNPGEPVLGTTAPLYGLILAALGAIGAPLPVASQWLSVMAWAGAVVLVWRLGREPDNLAAGLAPAALVATLPLSLGVLGMETHVVIALQLATVLLAVRRRWRLAFILAAIATWLRPDAALLAALLGLMAWVERRRPPWREAALYVAALAPWLLYAQLTYGSPIPNTLHAKAGQGLNPALGGTRFGAFLDGAVANATTLRALAPEYALVAALAVVGLVELVRRRPAWWPLVVWAGAYAVAYALIGVNASPWYYPPLWPCIALLAGAGAAACVRLVRRLAQRGAAPTTALAVLLSIGTFVPGMRAMGAYRLTGASAYYRGYAAVADWLRANTPADASVALIEIGIIGYGADRTVVDTMGLVTPAMVGHLEAWEQTLAYALARLHPDYAVALEGTAWDGLIGRDWFRDAYGIAARLPAPGPGARAATIYRRTHDPDAPPAVALRPPLDAGDVARLEAFTVQDVRLQPGELLAGRIAWRALRRPDADYRQRVELRHARTGQVHVLSQDHPLQGYGPTSGWQTGEVVEDARPWRLPIDLAPGPYLLRVTLIDAEETPLPFRDAQGVPAGGALGPLWVGAPDPTVAETSLVAARYGDTIDLVACALSPAAAAPGDTLEVALTWRARSAVSHDYTAFVHLTAADGVPVAQCDGQPLGGALPTSLWLPGITIPDVCPLRLPGDLPPGDYAVRVGLYHLATMERLDAVAPALPVADRAVEVARITVRP